MIRIKTLNFNINYNFFLIIKITKKMSFENSVDLFNIFRPTDFFEAENNNLDNEEIINELDLFKNGTLSFSHCYQNSKNFDIKVLLNYGKEMLIIKDCKISISNE